MISAQKNRPGSAYSPAAKLAEPGRFTINVGDFSRNSFIGRSLSPLVRSTSPNASDRTLSKTHLIFPILLAHVGLATPLDCSGGHKVLRDPNRLRRRSFRVTQFLIIALPLGWLSACDRETEQFATEQPSRAFDSPHRKIGSDLEKLISGASITELQAALESGQLSAQALTRHFLDQIEARNPELHAIISVNPEAIAVAQGLDAERKQGNWRGPLHGIPILVKDNIETREMATTAGSLALEGNRTGRDASVVLRLREAGAIILGKTNLSEWANFRSERSSSGWSAIGGQARNPYDITRSPCGSSSGSAIAVAAGMAVGALGTETDGSVVCPASVNGIVGIKPTVGLVSRAGIVPISHSQDTAGPMARSVADAAILLAAMLDHDPESIGARTGNSEIEQDYVGALDEGALRGTRIGVLRLAENYHEGVDALLGRAIATLKQAGATVVDGLELKPYEAFDDDSYDVLLYEFKHNLNVYLAGLPNDFNSLSLERLTRFNEQHAALEMPYFQQEIFLKSQAKGDLAEEAYTGALSRIRQATREDGIDGLLHEHRLDALIAPTSDPAWTIDLVNGDAWVDGFSTYPAVAGYPHITVPMGAVHGLPVGLSFTASALSERKLIGMAFAFEARAGVEAGELALPANSAGDKPTEIAPSNFKSDVVEAAGIEPASE